MYILYFERIIWIVFGYSLVLAQNIVFRDDGEQVPRINEPVHIPETLLIQMKAIHNVTDFIRKFQINQTIFPLETDSNLKINGRTALSDALTPFAEPANCKPEEHVVELEKPNNQAILFYPSCVRIKRCGGCCPSKRLTCKPTATSTKSVLVLQVRYNPEVPTTFQEQGIRTFDLEQHEQCTCDCKEKPDDCIADIHEYKESECRCVCINQEQLQNCKGSRKVWDSRNCLCKCREVHPCSTGRYYNMQKCRCEVLRNSLAMNSLDYYNTSRNSTL